jgi:hypothetical protein
LIYIYIYISLKQDLRRLLNVVLRFLWKINILEGKKEKEIDSQNTISQLIVC